MEVRRKIIEIDGEKCDGCGLCAPSCAEGAISIIDGKARIVSDNLCDGLGACIGECPKGALRITERAAEEFDEEAVERHLASLKDREGPREISGPSACPSATLRTFSPCEAANQPAATRSAISALSHWPCQIRLVPHTARFLKGADLLVPADCAGIAFPAIHSEFIKGRAVMMGCPKFDSAEEYVAKFTDVFREAQIRSVTCLIMEVPCCSGLPAIVKKAMDASGMKIPMETVTVGITGQIIKREKGWNKS